ncbi:MAG: hypothetical protein GY816_11970 [Cytophagales bacterium]|nr:hypothetical protein [Cytophagales bacterium]
MSVITAGILGAFALNNWNESSKDEVKKEALQRSLIAEFQGNIEQLDIVIQRHNLAIESGREFIRLIVDQEALPTAKGDSIFGQFYTAWTYDPRNGALRTGISSGDIHLLDNDSLLILLFNWEDLVADAIEDEKYAANHVHQDLNMQNRNVEWQNILPEMFPEGTIKKSNYQSLLADPEFEYFVTIQIIFSTNAVNELDLVRESNMKILELIEKDMKN